MSDLTSSRTLESIPLLLAVLAVSPATAYHETGVEESESWVREHDRS